MMIIYKSIRKNRFDQRIKKKTNMRRRKVIKTVKSTMNNFCFCLHLFLILELIGQPVEAFVETVATSGARRLNVPVAVAQRVQAQFVGDLGRVHCVWQILSSFLFLE